MLLRKSFDSLPQRVFYNYMLCLSPFRPVKSADVPEQAQAHMHALCKDIIQSLYDDPSLLNITAEPDDSFELYQCNIHKPELSKSIQNIGKKMRGLYSFLCSAALNGQIIGDMLTVVLDKKQMKVLNEIQSFLNHIGFQLQKDDLSIALKTDKYPQLFPAMRLLAAANAQDGQITGQTLFAFAFCVFDGSIAYLFDMIERELELKSGFIVGYFKEMQDRGCREEHKYGWQPDGPFFILSCNNAVSGLKIPFVIKCRHQLYFTLSTEIGKKTICDNFDILPEHIKEHLDKYLVDCYNCLGGTMGGKNPKFDVVITYKGRTRQLCPNSLWLGFQWPEVNDHLMRIIIDYSALQAQYGKNWRK